MVYWTKDMDKFLQKAHKDLSYTEIAVQISNKFDVEVSRNAAIGRANRIGMRKPKETKIIKKVKPKIEKVKPVKNEEEPVTPVKRGRPNKVPIEYKNYYESLIRNMDLPQVDKTSFLNPNARSLEFNSLKPKHCRFSLGDLRKGTLRFCAADVEPNRASPYCKYCHKIVYIPISEHKWRKRNEGIK